MCNYSAAGKEFRVSCKATETVGTLKQKICNEKGLSLSSVTLYCGPSLLTDETTIVSDLLEFADSFLLELPEAGEIEIQSEAKEVFLLTGSRKNFEAPLRRKFKTVILSAWWPQRGRRINKYIYIYNII